MPAKALVPVDAFPCAHRSRGHGPLLQVEASIRGGHATGCVRPCTPTGCSPASGHPSAHPVFAERRPRPRPLRSEHGLVRATDQRVAVGSAVVHRDPDAWTYAQA